MGLINKYIMSLFWFQRDGHKPFSGQSRQINAGKSSIKSCPNFWLLKATQTLMKMHLVSAGHGSSLVHNQSYQTAEYSWPEQTSCHF